MSLFQLILPSPFGKLVSLLPSYPGSIIFASALNFVLESRLPEDIQKSILGKQLRLYVTDAGLSFDFIWSKGGFVAGWDHALPDLVISATAHDFVKMARRQEDPDTLFFNRRLTMEGDTELGLIVKNTLDSLDLNPARLVASAPIQLLSRIWLKKT